MKLKNLFFCAAIALLAASCSADRDRCCCPTPVNVHITDFSLWQEDLQATKAMESVEACSSVRSVTLAFFDANGDAAYSSTQLKADEGTFDTFGDFSLALPYGSYKMVVIAHGGDFPITLSSLSEAGFGSEKPKETFLYSRDVNITNSTPVNLSATLSRIITRLIVKASETMPENLHAVRISFSKGGVSFNPMSGNSATDTGFVNTIYTTSAPGSVLQLRTTFFIASASDNIDITIETLDADQNVLNRRTIAAVPFVRNRATFLTGSLFSTNSSASFSVETSYENDYYMNF